MRQAAGSAQPISGRSAALTGDLPSILAWQGRDGGWGYRGGGSRTEPTAYALLALAALGHAGEEFSRGLAWLGRTQRSDGGWAPHPAVEESTWVTALPALLMAERPDGGDTDKTVSWLLRQGGWESGWVHRLRNWLLELGTQGGESLPGWPFYPGTAARVAPTALSILALERSPGKKAAGEVRQRTEAGREFLLARRCQDGGWNHGASRALGYEAGSYPETTGQALLVLRGVAAPRLGPSPRAAEESHRRCRSAEGLAWLRLALLAHGRTPGGFPQAVRCRTVVEAALWVLAEAARYFQTIPRCEEIFTDLSLDDIQRVALVRPRSRLRQLYLPRTVLGAELVVSLPKMKTHQGKAKTAGVLVAGSDPVAVDATCYRIMGIDPQKIRDLEMAAGNGQTREENLAQIGEAIHSVHTPFALLPEFARLRL